MSECGRSFERRGFWDYFRRTVGNILSYVQTSSTKMNNLEFTESPF